MKRKGRTDLNKIERVDLKREGRTDLNKIVRVNEFYSNPEPSLFTFTLTILFKSVLTFSFHIHSYNFIQIRPNLLF